MLVLGGQGPGVWEVYTGCDGVYTGCDGVYNGENS